MPLGSRRANRAEKVTKGAKSARKRSLSTPSEKEMKKFRKSYKEVGATTACITIMEKARNHIGTKEKPCRSEDLLQVMKATKAGIFKSPIDEPWMKAHVAKAFQDPIFTAQFNAFIEDPFGGLHGDATDVQKHCAFEVLAECFTWYHACTNGLGCATKTAICPNSLFQALMNRPENAHELWSTTKNMFIGGEPSKIGLLAGTQSVLKVSPPLAQPTIIQPHLDPNHEHLGWRGRGGGRGSGGWGRGGGYGDRGGGAQNPPGRKVCYFCKFQRGVQATDHMSYNCPYKAATHASEVNKSQNAGTAQNGVQAGATHPPTAPLVKIE